MSPADDTASEIIIRVEEASTAVKTTIAEAVGLGMSQEEVTKKMDVEIARQCDKVSNVSVREDMRRALVTSAKRWYWQIMQTCRIAEFNAKTQLMSANISTVKITDLMSKLATLTRDEMRSVLDDGANMGIPVIENYQKTIKIAIRAMAVEPPKVNTRGVVVPLRNRAEMAVRYDASVRDLASLRAKGVEYVWTSSHPNCSERCRRYQGRLWSLTGESGTVDGIPFRPIEEALKGPKGDGNGIISGYGCRHRLIRYTKGSRAPKDYSEAQMRREYALDQQQRRQERDIRRLKMEDRILRSVGFDRDASVIRKKWQEKQKKHQLWCIENNRASYPYRYIIDADELFEYGLKTQKTLTTNRKDGILNETTVKSNYIAAIERGDVSPLVDFQLYQKYRERVRTELLGMVTSNGILINSFSNHFIDRVFGSITQRRNGVDIEQIKDCLKSIKVGPVKREGPKYSQKIYGRYCSVSINPVTGQLIQVSPGVEEEIGGKSGKKI